MATVDHDHEQSGHPSKSADPLSEFDIDVVLASRDEVLRYDFDEAFIRGASAVGGPFVHLGAELGDRDPAAGMTGDEVHLLSAPLPKHLEQLIVVSEARRRNRRATIERLLRVSLGDRPESSGG
jgi:hypothetical protein